ncbi:DUF1842 domain-containing protein [Chromobacterium violaceum]|uniref:DUF1842 domain-containing protein n=1 Tax=Chromobacterium violaceum TaxID=536 RepID=UPI0005BBFC58|nr:DUF1842 domain-containing protein [Chromobacterium violaceum]
MAQEGLYLLKLSFTPPAGTTGAGRMILAVTVNASSGELHGQAVGTIHEGTQHPLAFTAPAAGAMHSTGYDKITKVGAVHGEAAVSVAPPAIGTYLAPFVASFALHADWTGHGQFTVGSDTYKCEVRMVD